ncbi:MAG: type I restriction endonuclease [Syntrophomonadaceae bacterium]
MGFKEDMQKLSVQITERKDHIANEEMAKQSLIIPFLQTLGFDVFNPLEVRPEYDSDFGKKKGEKVDYAIFKEGKPIIFIEAKTVSEKLENHDAQLSRYFNATPEVKVGIITNGIEYKFFTDLNTSNIMDESPFLQVNITALSDTDIETLARFKKDNFDSQGAVTIAEELIYTSNLNQKLEEIFKNPPDDFIRYLIKDFSDTRITANVLDKFRPIVKKSISQALLKMVSQSLSSQEPNVEQTIEENQTIAKDNEDSPSKKAEINTTEDEMQAFELITGILSKAGLDISTVNYKDTTNYFSVFTRNPSNWIVRLNLSATKKSITTNLPLSQLQNIVSGYDLEDAPKSIGISRVFINDVSDIQALSNLIVACFKDIVRG